MMESEISLFGTEEIYLIETEENSWLKEKYNHVLLTWNAELKRIPAVQVIFNLLVLSLSVIFLCAMKKHTHTKKSFL